MQTPPSDDVSSVSPISPVRLSERLSSIDVLRGVALLGILVINIRFFSNPIEKLVNPTLGSGFSGFNYYIWLAEEVIVFQKVWVLFSMLFGAGAFLLITRAEAAGKGAAIADIYYRRLFWLILFGLIHAYLIWSGDILFLYGVVGLFLYPVRKLSVRGMLIVVAGLLLTVTLMVYLDYRSDLSLKTEATLIESSEGAGEELTDEQTAVLEKWKAKNELFDPDQETLQKKIEVMSSGTYFEIIESEKEWVRSGHTDWLYGRVFFRILLMMILGMALMKSGVLTAKLKKRTYLSLVICGYAIGFSLAVFRIQYLLAQGFDPISSGASLLVWQPEMIAVALGHVGLICLFCKSSILGWLKTSLAAVGRMAFSNYVLQSLICTLVFYGYGFGLYGSLDKAEQLWVVASVWILQLILSPIWLRYFRFGPLEWVWRSLTYWQPQPMLMRT
jgi:uncharacterized protein